MEEQISVNEMLKRTVDLIGEIVVPVRYADQIARPLCQAVANIEAVIAAIREPEENKPEEGDGNV